MSATHQAELYEYCKDDCGNWVARFRGSQQFTKTSQAYERQVADDLANEHGLRQGEGYVVIIDLDDNSRSRLELAP